MAERDPKEGLAALISHGVTATARVDALLEMLIAKGLLDERDAERIKERGQELDRQYTDEAVRR